MGDCLFWGMKVGIIIVKHSLWQDHIRCWDIHIPYEKNPETQYWKVNKYIMLSTERTSRSENLNDGIGLCDILAKREGKHNFNVFWNREEASSLFKRMSDNPNFFAKCKFKDLQYGQFFPKELRANIKRNDLA